MKRYVAALGMVLVTLVPACCIYQGARHPAEKLTLPETLELETVALDRWVGVTGRDSDGDTIIGDVDPEKDPKAELKAYCTGVWVTKDTFLTAEHCVDDLGRPTEDPFEALLRRLTGAPKPEWNPVGQPCWFSAFGEVKDEAGKKFRGAHRAKVLAAARDHDLALVKVDKEEMELLPNHPIASVARSVRVGDEIHIVGHTVGMWWTYTHGWVAQLRPNMLNAENNRVDTIQVSAPIWFGNSGGGAFNADGELIGIASFIMKSANMGFLVDNETVRSFLAHNGIKR